MQLFYAPTSPFARKVRIAAAELDLADRIELIQTDPWTDARLRALNPLGKVPTLLTDDGQALFESGLICDYLDALAPEPRLVATAGPGRWRALLTQALADGAATAAGRLFADEQKPDDQRSDAVMARQALAREAALSALEKLPLDAERPAIGEIATAALLGYLDFRWPARDWRAGRDQLADWFAAMEARPSLIATRHHLPSSPTVSQNGAPP